jgi:hypothetical protein
LTIIGRLDAAGEATPSHITTYVMLYVPGAAGAVSVTVVTPGGLGGEMAPPLNVTV